MHKEIVINADPKETRVAILEDKQLVEPAIRETGNQRDAVADLFDLADLLEPGLRRQRRHRPAQRRKPTIQFFSECRHGFSTRGAPVRRCRAN